MIKNIRVIKINMLIGKNIAFYFILASTNLGEGGASWNCNGAKLDLFGRFLRKVCLIFIGTACI